MDTATRPPPPRPATRPAPGHAAIDTRPWPVGAASLMPRSASCVDVLAGAITGRDSERRAPAHGRRGTHRPRRSACRRSRVAMPRTFGAGSDPSGTGAANRSNTCTCPALDAATSRITVFACFTRSMSYAPCRNGSAAGVRGVGVLHGTVASHTWAPARWKRSIARPSWARYAADHAGCPGRVGVDWPASLTSNMSQMPIMMTTRVGWTLCATNVQSDSHGQSPAKRPGMSTRAVQEATAGGPVERVVRLRTFESGFEAPGERVAHHEESVVECGVADLGHFGFGDLGAGGGWVLGAEGGEEGDGDEGGGDGGDEDEGAAEFEGVAADGEFDEAVGGDGDGDGDGGLEGEESPAGEAGAVGVEDDVDGPVPQVEAVADEAEPAEGWEGEGPGEGSAFGVGGGGADEGGGGAGGGEAAEVEAVGSGRRGGST